MGEMGTVSRRSLLTLLGAGSLSVAMGSACAADLNADDGSFIRTLDISAERLLKAYPHGQRLGSVKPALILIEMFDYNCGYCRRAHQPLIELIAADSRTALHLVHFAILSPGSEMAAALQQAVLQRDGQARGLELHHALMGLTGRIDGDRARTLCERLNILVPSAQEIEKARIEIVENRRLATAFGIRYTPTFSLADSTFIGWPGPQTMEKMIMQARQCGRLQCS